MRAKIRQPAHEPDERVHPVLVIGEQHRIDSELEVSVAVHEPCQQAIGPQGFLEAAGRRANPVVLGADPIERNFHDHGAVAAVTEYLLGRLGNELGIPTGEAKEFIDAYFNRYPRIREYLERTLTEARNTGKVTTLFGRVRYIPEIHNRSFTVRSNAERMATNAPIQGTAADLLKLAMIALDARLDSEISEAAMLLTVHDEIVIEVPERWVDETEKLVRTTMETIYPLAVPLAVDTHWGRSWYEAKG